MAAIFLFPIRTISAISDLQGNALILPIKFQVNWPFGSRKEVENRFSRWRPWRPSWILDLNHFCSFWSTVQVAPIFPSKFGVSWPFGSREVKKKDCQDECHDGHLGFLIGTILDIFDLQVTQMLPTKFQVNWPFGSGEEAKNRFARWPPFPIETILASSDLQITPILPTKFQVNWHFGSGEEAKNRFQRWPPWRPSWISNWNDFS